MRYYLIYYVMARETTIPHRILLEMQRVSSTRADRSTPGSCTKRGEAHLVAIRSEIKVLISKRRQMWVSKLYMWDLHCIEHVNYKHPILPYLSYKNTLS